MPDQQTAIVLGAGLVGICTALALRERGYAVTMIDRDAPGQGASMGNAGVISPWSCVPQSMPGVLKKVPKWLTDPEGPVAMRWAYAPRMLPWLRKFIAAGAQDRLAPIADAMLALNKPNLKLYRKLLNGSGHEDLVRDGYYVYVSRNSADLNMDGLGWKLRTDRGVPVERVDRARLREVEPAIAEDYDGAILIHEQGRAVNPGRLGQVLADNAQRDGVKVVQAEISALRPNGNRWQIDAAGKTHDADIVTLTAGVWSVRLLATLGVKAPLEAERGYHMVFADPGALLNNPVHDMQSKVVVNSMEMGLRCAGTAEFAGIDAPANYQRAQVFAQIARRIVPDLNTASRTEWMGRRPSTPDSVPYIGPVPGRPGLFAGFGHGHLGLTGAPHTGQMLAALAAGEPLALDYAPYRLDRFA